MKYYGYDFLVYKKLGFPPRHAIHLIIKLLIDFQDSIKNIIYLFLWWILLVHLCKREQEDACDIHFLYGRKAVQ